MTTTNTQMTLADAYSLLGIDPLTPSTREALEPKLHPTARAWDILATEPREVIASRVVIDHLLEWERVALLMQRYAHLLPKTSMSPDALAIALASGDMI